MRESSETVVSKWQWREGFRRLVLAFNLLYLGLMAVIGWNVGYEAGHVTARSPKEQFNVETRCYIIRHPYGGAEAAAMYAGKVDRARKQESVYRVPDGKGGYIVVPVCQDVPDRFWWKIAYKASQQVTRPMFYFWLGLCAAYLALGWIARGFRPQRPTQ